MRVYCEEERAEVVNTWFGARPKVLTVLEYIQIHEKRHMKDRVLDANSMLYLLFF
jgi:hypothetical protein